VIGATWTIFRREFAGLFLQPVVWVLLLLASLLNGWLFSGVYLPAAGNDVQRAGLAVLGGSEAFWILVLVLAPLVTMRMISEEHRSGVLEFLLTAPVPDAAVVLGKLLAATSFFALLWSANLVPLVVASFVGAAPDWPQVLLAYGGMVLVSALFCSVGLAASAVSGAPVLAAFLAFVGNLALLMSTIALRFTDAIPSHVVSREVVAAIVDKFDVVGRYQTSFRSGVFDSGHVVFFVVWIAAFTFLTVRLLEMRRWR
jgi:ABC-2 type transport system permease protein